MLSAYELIECLKGLKPEARAEIYRILGPRLEILHDDSRPDLLQQFRAMTEPARHALAREIQEALSRRPAPGLEAVRKEAEGARMIVSDPDPAHPSRTPELFTSGGPLGKVYARTTPPVDLTGPDAEWDQTVSEFPERTGDVYLPVVAQAGFAALEAIGVTLGAPLSCDRSLISGYVPRGWTVAVEASQDFQVYEYTATDALGDLRFMVRHGRYGRCAGEPEYVRVHDGEKWARFGPTVAARPVLAYADDDDIDDDRSC